MSTRVVAAFAKERRASETTVREIMMKVEVKASGIN
jgi:hypothetical protein